MNFAVIKLQGHQEIVNAETRNLIVDRIEEKVGSIIKPDVLLTSVDGNIRIGEPYIDFPVELEIVKHQRGDKIYVSKFHAKARHRRRIGFRAEQTVLKVVKFGSSEEKTEKKVKKVTKTKVAVKKK